MINLICIKNKWSFRTAEDLLNRWRCRNLLKKIIESNSGNFSYNSLSPTSYEI